LQALCANCRYKFEVVRGRVVGRSTQEITVQQQTTKQSGDYRRAYEFRVERDGGGLEVLEFTVPGKDDWIRVRHGDTAAIVHTMRGTAREELLAIRNYTNGNNYILSHPGAASQKAATLWACVAAFIAVIIVFQLHLPMKIAVAIPVGALVVTRLVLRKRLAPIHEITPEHAAELANTQSLLQQKTQLQAQLARVTGEYSQRTALRGRLAALRDKMRVVGLAAYDSRIASIESALKTIDSQSALDRQLIEGYDRAIKILEIEYESGSIAGSLPEDVSAVVVQRQDELRAIEEHQAELARELAANVEVEQLLRSRA
jgi:hypothetical protein